MFAFLSGVGLWQSIDKNDNVMQFYKKRVVRVVIPYLLISIMFNLYLYIGVHRSLLQFLLDLTCISYWTEGRGAWYVAWIVPIYFIYPLYEKIAHKRSWISIVIVSILIFIVAVKGIPTRFQSVAGATLAFFIGDFVAKYISEDNKWCMMVMASLICIAPVYLSGLVRGQAVYVLFFAIVGISLCSIFALFMKYVPNTLRNAMRNVGGVSLECYLLNIYLITVVRHLFPVQMNSVFGSVIYLIIAILGVCISLLIGTLRKKVK